MDAAGFHLLGQIARDSDRCMLYRCIIRMYVYAHVCMYVCVYVCLCAYVCTPHVQLHVCVAKG
jgi:hypothetical protein